MVFYLVGATLTFSILFHAFCNDTTASKTDITSWLVLLVATLIWFITLPRILQKKLKLVGDAHRENWVKSNSF